LNPYNPRYAKAHLEGKEIDFEKGVEMFEEYREDIEPYGVEVA